MEKWIVYGFFAIFSRVSKKHGGAYLDFDLHLCDPADTHRGLSSQRSKSGDWSLLREHPLQWHGKDQSFSQQKQGFPLTWHHKELRCDGGSKLLRCWVLRLNFLADPDHKLNVKRQHALQSLQSQCHPNPFPPNIPKWNLKSWSFLFIVPTWKSLFWYPCQVSGLPQHRTSRFLSFLCISCGFPKRTFYRWTGPC